MPVLNAPMVLLTFTSAPPGRNGRETVVPLLYHAMNPMMVNAINGSSINTPSQLVSRPEKRAPRTFNAETSHIKVTATKKDSHVLSTNTPPIVAPSRKAGMKYPR